VISEDRFSELTLRLDDPLTEFGYADSRGTEEAGRSMLDYWSSSVPSLKARSPIS